MVAQVPRVLTAPKSVFAARETDEVDVDAGRAGACARSSRAWRDVDLGQGTVMNDPDIDCSSSLVTFIGGLVYGAAGYFLLGLPLWLGAKAVGVGPPFQITRESSPLPLPLALYLAVVVPAIPRVRRGLVPLRRDDDAGNGRTVITGIGLVFVLSRSDSSQSGPGGHPPASRGIVAALMLAGVLVAAFAVLPSAL